MAVSETISQYRREMVENQSEIRKMILESICDMQAGKGRDYKEFFDELEKRYQEG